MKHRIIVLGAGYAGAFGAGYLARHLHSDDFAITVVNAEPDFVERLRLHQVAAGQDLKHRPLTEVFAGTDIELKIARVTAVDPGNRTVAVTDGQRIDLLEYDTLLYTLGSTAAVHAVPGVEEHAFHVAARPSALRLRDRLDELNGDGTLLVIGGNLTAIEAATEIAESRPGLRVEVATSGELGGWLGPAARDHLLRAFNRFGILVHEHSPIERVTADGVYAADGTFFASDATVWAAGFAVHPIAAESGLAVEANGQITVDRQMRSVSHPEVFAAGDAVFTLGDNGKPLPMNCGSAGFSVKQATTAIIAELTGREVVNTGLGYFGNHISLGRKDAIYQLVDGDATSKPGAFRGRTTARVKNSILNAAAWSAGHPTFGMPARKHRLAAQTARPAEAAAA